MLLSKDSSWKNLTDKRVFFVFLKTFPSEWTRRPERRRWMDYKGQFDELMDIKGNTDSLFQTFSFYWVARRAMWYTSYIFLSLDSRICLKYCTICTTSSIVQEEPQASAVVSKYGWKHSCKNMKKKKDKIAVPFWRIRE